LNLEKKRKRKREVEPYEDNEMSELEGYESSAEMDLEDEE